jgi:hypothetical protein
MSGARPARGHGKEKLDAGVSVLSEEAATAGRDSDSPIVGSPAVHSLWLGNGNTFDFYYT